MLRPAAQLEGRRTGRPRRAACVRVRAARRSTAPGRAAVGARRPVAWYPAWRALGVPTGAVHEPVRVVRPTRPVPRPIWRRSSPPSWPSTAAHLAGLAAPPLLRRTARRRALRACSGIRARGRQRRTILVTAAALVAFANGTGVFGTSAPALLGAAAIAIVPYVLAESLLGVVLEALLGERPAAALRHHLPLDAIVVRVRARRGARAAAGELGTVERGTLAGAPGRCTTERRWSGAGRRDRHRRGTSGRRAAGARCGPRSTAPLVASALGWEWGRWSAAGRGVLRRRRMPTGRVAGAIRGRAGGGPGRDARDPGARDGRRVLAVPWAPRS